MEQHSTGQDSGRREHSTTARIEGAASGLVYSETSVTARVPGGYRVDQEAVRKKRLRRSVLTSARLHCQEKARWKVAMVTCTYRPGVSWEPRQITGCVAGIREYLRRRGIELRYTWVQEFTKRGRPHYHLLVWLPAGITLPKPDKRGWWAHGMTKIEWARNAVGYIAKYASKGASLDQPAVGARMHGNGGLTGNALAEKRWWALPHWTRSQVKLSQKVQRCRGGFVLSESGEFLESPWEVRFSGGSVWIRKKNFGEPALPAVNSFPADGAAALGIIAGGKKSPLIPCGTGSFGEC